MTKPYVRVSSNDSVIDYSLYAALYAIVSQKKEILLY